MSSDQCRQQCPYAHRLEYVRLSTTFLLTSDQHSDPVVYQLRVARCIVAQVMPMQSFSLWLILSVRVHRFIGGFFGGCSREGTVSSSCVRELLCEGVVSGESGLDTGGSFVGSTASV
jgi:hypothetical protein